MKKITEFTNNKAAMLALLVVGVIILLLGFVAALVARQDAILGGGERNINVNAAELLKAHINENIVPAVKTSTKDGTNPYGILVKDLIGDNNGFHSEISLDFAQGDLTMALDMNGFAKLNNENKDLERYTGDGTLTLNVPGYEIITLTIEALYDGSDFYIMPTGALGDVPPQFSFLKDFEGTTWYKVDRQEFDIVASLFSGIDTRAPMPQGFSTELAKDWERLNLGDKSKPAMVENMRLACFGGDSGTRSMTICLNQQNFPLYLAQTSRNDSLKIGINMQMLLTGTNLADSLMESVQTPPAEQVRNFRNLLGYS